MRKVEWDFMSMPESAFARVWGEGLERKEYEFDFDEPLERYRGSKKTEVGKLMEALVKKMVDKFENERRAANAKRIRGESPVAVEGEMVEGPAMD